MIPCDPNYQRMLNAVTQRLMQQHPNWPMARIVVRARIEVMKANS